MSQNLSALLSKNDITYNALQNSLANAQLQDTDKVTLTANGLEKDNRVRHFVSLGSWKTTNQSIMQQTKDLASTLQNVLIDKFGKSTGQTLFNRYITKRNIEGKQRITVQTLKQLFNEAKVQESNLTKVLNGIHADRGQMTPSNELLKACNVEPELFRTVIVRAAKNMDTSSHTFKDLVSHLNDLGKTCNDLLYIKDFVFKAKVPAEMESQKKQLLQTLDSCFQSTIAKTKEIGNELANYPLSKNKIQQATQNISDACILTVENLLVKNKNNPKVFNKLLNCRQEIFNKSANFLETLKNVSDVSVNQTSFLKGFAKDIAKKISDATGIKKEEILNTIKDFEIKNFEHKEWDCIDKKFSVTCNNQNVTVNSVITPASKLPILKEEMMDNGEPIGGVVCQDQKRTTHAVNLWKTDFSYNGKELYSGFRHGVNCAYDIEDNQTRTEANNNRAKDIFKAALAKNPKLLEKALKGETVDLNIVSVSLLTPDLPRDIFSKKRASKERTQLAEQTAAWKGACNPNGTCNLQITDENGVEHTVTVKPKVLTFNYGVNPGAQKTLLQSLSCNWGKSNELNNEAIEKLVGDPNSKEIGGIAGEFLKTCNDQATKNKITILANQIKELHTTEGYRTAGEDPFRMPARINLLSYLCGLTPCFNCKSGKDRTGQLDASTKELALTLEMKGQLSMKTTQDTERKNLLSTIALNSGNLEVQELNTGVGGFKLKHYDGLEKIYNENIKHLQGLSANVSG